MRLNWETRSSSPGAIALFVMHRRQTWRKNSWSVTSSSFPAGFVRPGHWEDCGGGELADFGERWEVSRGSYGLLREDGPRRLWRPSEDIGQTADVIQAKLKIIVLGDVHRVLGWLRSTPPEERKLGKPGDEDGEQSTRRVSISSKQALRDTHLSIPTRLLSHVLTVMNSCVFSSVRASSIKNSGRVSMTS